MQYEEYFKDESSKVWIQEQLLLKPAVLKFSHYYKYYFHYSNGDSRPEFKIDADYGGDADVIYRHHVSSEQVLKITSIEQMKNLFTGVTIHNFTNELVYSWEVQI